MESGIAALIYFTRASEYGRLIGQGYPAAQIAVCNTIHTPVTPPTGVVMLGRGELSQRSSLLSQAV